MTMMNTAVSTTRFGYAGRWSPDLGAVQLAAYLVNNPAQPTGMLPYPVPVGVEAINMGTPYAQYRVVTGGQVQEATSRNGLLSLSA